MNWLTKYSGEALTPCIHIIQYLYSDVGSIINGVGSPCSFNTIIIINVTNEIIINDTATIIIIIYFKGKDFFCWNSDKSKSCIKCLSLLLLVSSVFL